MAILHGPAAGMSHLIQQVMQGNAVVAPAAPSNDRTAVLASVVALLSQLIAALGPATAGKKKRKPGDLSEADAYLLYRNLATEREEDEKRRTDWDDGDL